MTELLVKNACVIDPIRGINGEIMDIAIRDGRIVESVSDRAEVIDAQRCLTLPGGIDSHTHVCGTKVNFGRYMSPEDMRAGQDAAAWKDACNERLLCPDHVREQLPVQCHGLYDPARRCDGTA